MNNAMLSSISVNPFNSMEGIQSLNITSSDTLAASIHPRISKSIVASINVPGHAAAILHASIDPKYYSNISGWILPRHQVSIPATIGVSPLNSMEGIVTLVQPPTITMNVSPIIDTFVRDGIPRINYGLEEEALVGNINGELFRALYRFDVSSVPLGVTIKKAVLHLYSVGYTSNASVATYDSLGSWTERGCTWANQPELGEKLATNTVNGENIEIDLMSSIPKWLTGVNDGIVVTANDEVSESYVRLGTRENEDYAPYLEIVYVDNVIRNPGVSNRPASITVRHSGVLDMLATIQVDSKNIVDGLAASILVPLTATTYILSSTISVSRKWAQDKDASIIVPIYDRTVDLEASIEARLRDNSNLASSILVPIYGIVVDIPADIEVRVQAASDLASSILVPIYPGSTELISDIEVRAWGDSNLTSSILVPIYDSSSDVEASIEVRVSTSNNLTSSIFVPTYTSSSDVESSIEVRLSTESDLESSILVPIHDSASELIASIEPRYSVPLVASITVRRSDVDNILSTISTRSVEVLPASIFVISGFLGASITVPEHAMSEIPATLLVQIRLISDLECYIRVGGSNGAYAFIM